MKLASMLLISLVGVGCAKRDPLYCDEMTPCTDPALPFCDLAGEYPASEGIGRTCIPNPFDAGMPDGAPGDADPTTPDASTGPDAAPTPPVTTGQAAVLVLGQPDFDSNLENNGGLSGRSLYAPRFLDSDGTHLWIADSANKRVLQYNALPVLDFAMADVAIGQTSLGAVQDGPTQELLTGIFGPFEAPGIAHAGEGLVASDPTPNRLLLWDGVPTLSGADAVRVLGQSSFTSGSGQLPSATSLNDPAGVWTDGNRVAVADFGNNRVLIWDSWPTTNGQPADLVLGQSSMSGDGATVPPTANSISTPMDVHFDGQRFWVVSFGDHRVMVWNGWPTQNNQAADYVIGQQNFQTANPNAGGAGPNALGMNRPQAIAVGRDSLFVADEQNHRVLVYTPIPTQSGVMAAAVLGQPSFDSGDPGIGAAQLTSPAGLTVAGNRLFVSDWGNHRVMAFDLSP